MAYLVSTKKRRLPKMRRRRRSRGDLSGTLITSYLTSVVKTHQDIFYSIELLVLLQMCCRKSTKITAP